MMKLPYFPCYARDVLSSSKIALMSGEAFKAYWLLLCASWLEDERATLPNNEAKLEALARVGASTWLEIKDEVLACFDTAGNGRLFSPRLLEVSLLQEKRREAGSKGGSKTQANPQANFKQNLKHQSQSSESELETEVELKAKPKIGKRKRIEYPAEFERLWQVHSIGGKSEAFKAFGKYNPSESEIERWIEKIGEYQQTERWQRGVFPNLSTWINQGYFDGEIPAASKKPVPFVSLTPQLEEIHKEANDV